jgi:hypothetical protein
MPAKKKAAPKKAPAKGKASGKDKFMAMIAAKKKKGKGKK